MAPKITKCQNGHFFDSEKYDSCPFCVQNAQNTIPDVQGDTYTIPVIAPGPDPIQKTVPLDGIDPNKTVRTGNKSDDTQKTVGLFDIKSGEKSPVVGWIVCTSGKHYGEDFRIKAGNNFIGRNLSMDIVLSKDPSISREKHIIIVYDPKSKQTIIRPGDTHELSYINDEVIVEPKNLKKFDKLQIGTSEFVFVPFCGDGFEWKEKEEQ